MAWVAAKASPTLRNGPSPPEGETWKKPCGSTVTVNMGMGDGDRGNAEDPCLRLELELEGCSSMARGGAAGWLKGGLGGLGGRERREPRGRRYEEDEAAAGVEWGSESEPRRGKGKRKAKLASYCSGVGWVPRSDCCRANLLLAGLAKQSS